MSSALLAVADVADQLGVSTKTVRRWIASGRLVSYRIGPNSVRVDASSVDRLLTASPFEAAAVNDNLNSKKNGSSNEPRLLRQRGRSKVWTAQNITGEEVPLGTTDERVARQRLGAVREEAEDGPQQVRRPWRVYPSSRGGWEIKYYDKEGKRRTHRLLGDAGVLVTSEEEAENYAGVWFRENVERAGPKPVAVASVFAADADRISFEQFGRLWTSGELAKRYPDHVREKRTAKADEGRLRMYVFPIIGHMSLSAFEGAGGLGLAEKVLEALPPVGKTFSRGSRRQVMQSMNKLFGLAVYPAKLLSANPLPKGFLPKGTSNKAKSYVYPDEDAKLMACTKVPLVRRLFYGILAREGFRASELLSLKWSNLDLDHGSVRLDENKTDEPRVWALDPGVAEALRRWKKNFAGTQAPSTVVLTTLAGTTLGNFSAASGLRRALKKAGVNRAELFQSGETRLQLRAHDLRATFVTVSLAAGKTEAWITDRTGHKSSQMIYRYKRAARFHAELKLGALAPLHEAIPELARVTS